MRFELAGFKAVARQGISVSAGFVATVDMLLEVGGVEETVVVTGGFPTIDTKWKVQQTVMSQQVLESVPTGRDVWSRGSTDILRYRLLPKQLGGSRVRTTPLQGRPGVALMAYRRWWMQCRRLPFPHQPDDRIWQTHPAPEGYPGSFEKRAQAAAFAAAKLGVVC